MLLQIITESAGLLIALITGAYAFRCLTPFCRIVYSQVALAALIYTAARVITTYQMAHAISLNNQWVYNVYILGETTLLLVAATVFLKRSWATVLGLAGLSIALLSFAYHLASSGFGHFANTTQIVSGMIVLTTYILMIRHLTRTPDFEMKTSPEMWLILGICLYFACTVPFLGLIHYLYSRWPETTETLFNFIINVLGNIRYLLAALSFWLLFRQRRIIPNES